MFCWTLSFSNSQQLTLSISNILYLKLTLCQTNSLVPCEFEIDRVNCTLMLILIYLSYSLEHKVNIKYIVHKKKSYLSIVCQRNIAFLESSTTVDIYGLYQICKGNYFRHNFYTMSLKVIVSDRQFFLSLIRSSSYMYKIALLSYYSILFFSSFCRKMGIIGYKLYRA